MRVVEGRRLTGPNWLLRTHGAAVQVAYDPGEVHATLSKTWKARVMSMTTALGWPQQARLRVHQGGATFALAAPIDLLNTAVDVAEWAVEPERFDRTADARRTFREAAKAEANPAFAALAEFAWELDLPFLWDEKVVSLGFGASCLCWPIGDLPEPSELYDRPFQTIPVALVTGTNGKTTTSRLLAHMARCEGLHVGNTSTDGWSVDEHTVEEGDWTGPGAARKVLRDPRVEVAVLETARGGLLRRGLATNLASVAVVTNVSNDHLGEWGVDDLDDMASAKLSIRRGLRPGGKLVLNAGNSPLVRVARDEDIFVPTLNTAWFCADPRDRTFDEFLRSGAETACVRDGVLVYQCGPHREYVLALSEAAFTFGGQARHNVENALAAVLAARGLGLGWPAIRDGLRSFASNPADNPGRANVLALNGGKVMLDFAHNADGVRSIVQLARALPATRRLITLGQAGDRSDEAIAELALIARELDADRYLLKETEHYLRGRTLGEVTGLMRKALMGAGVDEARIGVHMDEATAVEAAAAWVQAGDLAVVLVHDSFSAALKALQARGATPA
ncbi:MAG: Mur ligase [Deltaproteobacteria bacterium]|nr:Mur ligase [Deltaproteobacteria bacterium]